MGKITIEVKINTFGKMKHPISSRYSVYLYWVHPLQNAFAPSDPWNIFWLFYDYVVYTRWKGVCVQASINADDKNDISYGNNHTCKLN